MVFNVLGPTVLKSTSKASHEEAGSLSKCWASSSAFRVPEGGQVLQGNGFPDVLAELLRGTRITKGQPKDIVTDVTRNWVDR